MTMKTLKTSVNYAEFEDILQFCEERNLSLYTLVKTAIFTYIENEAGRSFRQPHRTGPAIIDRDLIEVSIFCKEHGIDLGKFLKDALTTKLQGMKDDGEFLEKPP